MQKIWEDVPKMLPKRAQDGLQEASGIDLGRFSKSFGKVLGGFEGVLGMFWLDFGKVLVKAGEGFGKLKKGKLFARLSMNALSVPPLGQV